MPQTSIIFFKEVDGSMPVMDWLDELRKTNYRAFTDCVSRIELLKTLGHELRRPHADYLRDGIYELRTRRGNVHYRILYFFHGRNVAILANSLTKEKEIPPVDIDRAIKRKLLFEGNPKDHTGSEEIENG